MRAIMIGPRKLALPFYDAGRLADDKRRRHTRRHGETRDFTAAVRAANERRYLDCEQYEKCLDKAAAANWPGFDCGTCKLFWQRRFLNEEPA